MANYDANALFDDVLAEEREPMAVLTKSAVVAHNTNPDLYAKNVKQVRNQGMPDVLALPALTPIDTLYLEELKTDFSKLTPKSAEFFGDFNNARIAHDDHKQLTLVDKVLNPFKGAGAAVAKGVNTSMGATAKAFTGSEGIYKEGAEYWDTKVKEYGMTGIPEKVYEGLGAAPMGVTEFIANVPYAIAKGGAEGYQENGIEGMIKGALTEGVKRFGIGKVFHSIGNSSMTPVEKSVTMAGTMGAQTAAEGGSIEDTVAATMVGLALMPPGANTKGEVIKAELLKKGVDPKIAQEIGFHADGVIAETNAQNLMTLLKRSQESKLKGRSVEDFKEFVKLAKEESPPATMPVEKFEKILEEKGLKPEDVLTDPTAYHEAKLRGEKDVVIPIEDIAGMAEHITPETAKGIRIGGEDSVNEVAAKVEAAKVETPVGTPAESKAELKLFDNTDTKESSLAIRAEADAIAAKMTEDFGALPEYTKMSMQEQATRAAEIMDADYTQAKRMAMGEIPPPEGVREATMFEAVKIRAIKEGDVETLRKLATESTVPGKLSEYGQAIKAADSRLMDDPVKVMQDIIDARKAMAEKTGRKNAATTEHIAKLESLLKAAEEKMIAYEERLSKKHADKILEGIKAELGYKARRTTRKSEMKVLDAEAADIFKQINKLAGRVSANPMLDPTFVKLFAELAKNRLKAGVVTVEGIVDYIHTNVKTAFSSITKREIRDAISGYGKTGKMSQEEIDIQLREVKRLARLISAYEDATAGQSPLKSGMERDPVTPEVKAMQKEIRLAMKEAGLTVSKDTQFRTPLETFKKRTNTMINKYQKMLDERTFDKKERVPVTLDAEGKKLKRELDRAKEDFKTGQNAAGILTAEEATKIVKMSQDVADARTAMEAGGDRLTYGAAKVAYENFANDLKGDNRTLSQMAKDRADEFKTTAKENKAGAVADLTKDTLGFIADNSVAMVASLDNSFMGRQGLKVLMTHPSAWYPAAKQSFVDLVKALGNQPMKDALLADIYSRPNYVNGEYQRAKILPKVEEQYPTSIPERVPGWGRVFKASEIAFTGSAMRMRTDLYDLLSTKAKENGVDMTSKVEAESLGKLINSLTARGQWGKTGEPPLVRLFMWAPKMLKANIDVLTAHNFTSGLESNFARKEAATNLLKIVTETAMIMAIANALKPGSAEMDPNSADFGKIKIGTTRFDITGGAGSLVVLASRILRKATKNSDTGITKEFGTGFGEANSFDALVQFLTNKTTPSMKVLVDWLKGTNIKGEPFTWGTALYGAFTPIAVQNFIELKDDASADKVAGAIIDLVGINTSTRNADTDKNRDLINRLRNNRAFTKEQQEKFDKLTAKEQQRLDEYASMTPLEEAFHKLPLDAAVFAWSKLDNDKREEVIDMYEEKINNYFLDNPELSEEDIERMNKIIEQAEKRDLSTAKK